MRTSRKTDFRKLKITLATMTYHSQRPQCPSLFPHVLLVLSYISFYADGTELYTTFKTSCPYDMESALLKIEACIRDIELWMLINKLQMKNGKIDVLPPQAFSAFCFCL